MPEKKLRVLVIDDEASVRQVIERYLAAQGFSVVSLGDAETALKLLATEKFDAILLDNNLPGIMGIAALARIVGLTKAPVIAITGFPDEETRKDLLLIGARAFMAKPLDMEEVVAKIRELTGKKG
ncbi:MAG: response regulator transcription factor [Planctomycetota bacterium]